MHSLQPGAAHQAFHPTVTDLQPLAQDELGVHPDDPALPAGLRDREDVQQEIARGVEAANVRLSRVEQIKRYAVLDVDWLPGGDELTPTMKLKRKPIHAKYAAQIEELYGEERSPQG